MRALRVIDGGGRSRGELEAEIARLAAEQEHARDQAVIWDRRAIALLLELADRKAQLAALTRKSPRPCR